MTFNFDTSELTQTAARRVTPHDNCIVTELSSGAFPRKIKVQLPDDDGPQQAAIWDGSLDLEVNDEVYCHEYAEIPAWRIMAMGGNDSGAGKHRVSKVWESDFENVVMSIDAAGLVTFQPAADSTTFLQVLDASGGVPVLNVDTTNERVGVGEEAPGVPLHITRTSTNELVRLETAATGNPFLAFHQTSTRRAYIQFADTGNDFRFLSGYGSASIWTDTGGSPNRRITVTSSGDIGINTASPDAKLHIAITDTSIDSSLDDPFGLTNDLLISENEAPQLVGLFATNTLTRGFNLVARRAKGTLGVPTAVSDGTVIFNVLSEAHDGTQIRGQTAQIRTMVDGSVSGDVIPVKIEFKTSLTNTAALNSALTIRASGDIEIEGDSDANLFFTDAGNDTVGIGTNSPSTKFHAIDEDVVTAAITDIVTLGHNSTGSPISANFGAGLLYQLKSSTSEDQDAARIAALWTEPTHGIRASTLVFETLTGAGSLTEQMRIDGNGNVGIGEPLPTTRLQVAEDSIDAHAILAQYSATTLSTTNTFGLAMINTDISANSVGGIKFNLDDTGGGGRNAGWIALGKDGAWTAGNNNTFLSYLAFGTRRGSSGVVESMRIDSAGVIISTSGRKKKHTLIDDTDSPYTVLATDEIIFVDTDTAAVTVNLPAGDGQHYRIVNTGSSGNDVTVDPDGTEELFSGGAGVSFALIDAEIINIYYETTKGWW